MGAYKLNIGDANNYLKWDGLNLYVRGNIVIEGGSGIANLTDAGALATLDDIAYAAITGAKPPVDADKTADVVSNLAYYNMVGAALLDSTIIIGGYIKTSLLTADNIRTGTLDAVKVKVGSKDTQDIVFKHSGISLYDATGYQVNFYKAGRAQFGIYLNPSYSEIMTTTLKVYASGKIFTFHTAGGFQMCNIYSQPTGHAGDIAYNSSKHRFQCYIGGSTNAWGYELMSAGW